MGKGAKWRRFGVSVGSLFRHGVSLSPSIEASLQHWAYGNLQTLFLSNTGWPPTLRRECKSKVLFYIFLSRSGRIKHVSLFSNCVFDARLCRWRSNPGGALHQYDGSCDCSSTGLGEATRHTPVLLAFYFVPFRDMFCVFSETHSFHTDQTQERKDKESLYLIFSLSPPSSPICSFQDFRAWFGTSSRKTTVCLQMIKSTFCFLGNCQFKALSELSCVTFILLI